MGSSDRSYTMAGTGGSIGMADPDLGIGYAYTPTSWVLAAPPTLGRSRYAQPSIDRSVDAHNNLVPTTRLPIRDGESRPNPRAQPHLGDRLHGPRGRGRGWRRRRRTRAGIRRRWPVEHTGGRDHGCTKPPPFARIRGARASVRALGGIREPPGRLIRSRMSSLQLSESRRTDRNTRVERR
jgi:hypothetical protein